MSGIREDHGIRLIGLRLTLEPGWKTYWRSPGQAGIPPHFDWSASQNIASVEVMWPRPEVFESFGYQTIGYSERVVLPLRITPMDETAPIGLEMTVDLGVCKELCVLERIDFAETITDETPEVGVRELRRAYASIPRPAPDAGLTEMACKITGTGSERRFAAELTFSDQAFIDPTVLVEGSETLWIRETQTRLEGQTISVTGRIEMPEGTTWVDRGDMRMTVLDGIFAADVQGCRTSAG